MEDKVQQDWDRQTFNHWSHLVKSVQPEELGIEVKTGQRNFYLKAPSTWLLTLTSVRAETGSVLLVARVFFFDSFYSLCPNTDVKTGTMPRLKQNIRRISSGGPNSSLSKSYPHRPCLPTLQLVLLMKHFPSHHRCIFSICAPPVLNLELNVTLRTCWLSLRFAQNPGLPACLAS